MGYDGRSYGEHGEATDIGDCLFCWEHECACGEVDECGVSITSTYALLLAKPRQKHVRNVLDKCYR